MSAALHSELHDALAGLWGGASDRRIPGVASGDAPQGVAPGQIHEPLNAAASPPAPRNSAPPRHAARIVPLDHWAAQAARIAAALAEGAEERTCPLGGLSLIQADGREFWISGREMEEIAARNLMPLGLLSTWGKRDAAASIALAEFYAAPADPRAYHSDCADALRDGLLAGYHRHSADSA